MKQSITYQPLYNLLSPNRIELWTGIIALVIALSVFQDFLFSQLQNTGFYLSESLLYNSIWGFLAPFAALEIRLLKRIKFKNNFRGMGTLIGSSVGLTMLHIFVFTSFFISVSFFAFSPTHHFLNIFNAALSNQFYILVVFYVLFPFLIIPLTKKSPHSETATDYAESIKVKVGLKIVSLKTEAIEVVSTAKPYSLLISNDKKYLDSRTLKDFETLLNPNSFVRVHRSAIINKNFVKELKSRQNGDYDAQLHNGQVVRFSRHYRANWQDLLH